MRPRPQFVFGLVITLIAAWGLLETRAWPIKTALYARVVTIPLLVLAAAETILSLRMRDEAGPAETTDVMLTSTVAPQVASRRTAVMFAWLGGFFLAIWLLGFPLAIPVFVFAYLRGQAREGWVISLAFPTLAWLGFYLLFIRLLHLPFPAGLLWQAVGR